MGKSKKKGNKKKGPSRGGANPKGNATANPLKDSRVQKYLGLLADPCSGTLAHPPYAGTDAGYLVRTTELIGVSATDGSSLTPGATGKMDAIVSITPSGYISYARLNGATTQVGGNITLGNSAGTASFLSTAAVRRFRPVAACAKWVPSGPYATRQGTVGTMYGVGTIENAGQVTTATAMLATCTRTAPNGGEMHEVRWLPTSFDENFTTATAFALGGGTMTIVLSGVDGTASNATNLNANGFVEVTIVWEWTPSSTANVTVNPQAPMPYTTQSVLSNIGDMGAFLFQGVMKAGEGIVRGAATGAMVGLTAGVRNYATRGRSMPLLQ